MAYAVKTPWWLSRLVYPRLTWSLPVGDAPAVYLTFDDGPHPTITPFVLEQLKRYDAQATFFCIGKNVADHPDIYKQILEAQHTVGNHTHNHLNGWHTKTDAYIGNVQQAAKHINSRLFRPPYGRIKRSQAGRLLQAHPQWHIYMWDVLSGDFDTGITAERCTENVLNNIQPGSIVVFHDSEKAWPRMQHALPAVLAHCKQQNWQLKALPQ